METRSQTNEQPLPGSALQLFINRDAEALMALIFQDKRRLVLAAAPEERESLHQRRSPRARRQRSSCRCCSAGFGTAEPRGEHLCQHAEPLRFGGSRREAEFLPSSC